MKVNCLFNTMWDCRVIFFVACVIILMFCYIQLLGVLEAEVKAAQNWKGRGLLDLCSVTPQWVLIFVLIKSFYNGKEYLND